MTPEGTLVGAAGGALVLVNFWTGKQHAPVTQALSSNATTAQLTAGHQSFTEVGGELVLVLILTVLASSSEALGKGIVGLIALLWLLFALNHFGGSAKKSTKATG